jgi:hypothetical protein
MSNSVSLDEYRKRRFPDPDAIMAEMQHTIDTVESEMERDIMFALLSAFESGDIVVTRSKEGDLQYALPENEV